MLSKSVKEAKRLATFKISVIYVVVLMLLYYHFQRVRDFPRQQLLENIDVRRGNLQFHC